MDSGGYSPIDLEKDVLQTIPVLSLYGEDDNILPRATFEKLSQKSKTRAGVPTLSQEQLVRAGRQRAHRLFAVSEAVFREACLPQCGHVPHLEQADATAEAITAFVSEVGSMQAVDLSTT